MLHYDTVWKLNYICYVQVEILYKLQLVQDWYEYLGIFDGEISLLNIPNLYNTIDKLDFKRTWLN